MTSGPLARINEAFGWPGFPDALFYKADNALRFELADNTQGEPMRLLHAMDRARVIVGDIFAQSETLTAIVSHYGGRKRTRRDAISFKKLSEIGFHHSFSVPDRVPQHDEDYVSAFGEDLYRYWYEADFEKSEKPITALLWAALTREGPIMPKARWLDSIYLVDFARKIVVHPYDTRGMDLVAIDYDTIKSIYHRHGDWLFSYDREAMDSKFYLITKFT